MIKILGLTSFIIFCSLCAIAQNTDSYKNQNTVLTFELGASVNYYYGMPSRNFGEFDNDRVNWQINGMLGLTIGTDKADRRTMIAAFGNFGLNNNQTVSNMLTDQKYTTAATGQADVNNSYRIEGGIIIADLIRVSTGSGQQNFNSQALAGGSGGVLSTTYLKYNSSTVGVRLKLGVVSWTIDCNFEYGQDFTKTVIIPSSGLMFRF
jgi:hypothetical protein